VNRPLRFRVLLPVVETTLATLAGGIGLWQRHQILNQRFLGDHTLWESTARFHVWPLPLRFAVVSNVPSFLASALVRWPLKTLWPQMPETLGFLPLILFVPLLWYLVGLHSTSSPPLENEFG
jgi:hypothetical protein